MLTFASQSISGDFVTPSQRLAPPDMTGIGTMPADDDGCPPKTVQVPGPKTSRSKPYPVQSGKQDRHDGILGGETHNAGCAMPRHDPSVSLHKPMRLTGYDKNGDYLHQ